MATSPRFREENVQNTSFRDFNTKEIASPVLENKSKVSNPFSVHESYRNFQSATDFSPARRKSTGIVSVIERPLGFKLNEFQSDLQKDNPEIPFFGSYRSAIEG